MLRLFSSMKNKQINSISENNNLKVKILHYIFAPESSSKILTKNPKT